MNIFVAGIHGVGKTYLASRSALAAGMTHTSASKLIKEERALVTWTNDKRVTDVDANQQALATALRRHNESGIRLLLDGHFVLLDGSGEMTRLDVVVFSALNLDGVVLVEENPQVVAQRIEERDKRQVLIADLQMFMEAERNQAQEVCTALNIPLVIIVSPSPEEFVIAVARIQTR